MKQYILALPLALTAALFGTSVYANTGTINFEGRITNNTCPIEIINPDDGSVGNQVKMGTVQASHFTAVGQEYRGKGFGLRVPAGPGCGFTPVDNTATVTFNGPADTTGDYFAIFNLGDSATGVAISLRDDKGNSVKPGQITADYDLNATGYTDILFNAYYRSTAIAVTAGSASADVQFVVAIN